MELDLVVAKKQVWETEKARRGVRGSELEEMLHHHKILANKNELFLRGAELV